LARDCAALFFKFSAILSLLAFILALASSAFLAWLEAVTLLACAEALFALIALEIGFFFALIELGALLLSETLAPSAPMPLSGFRPGSDLGLRVAFVLNLIIDTGSLAGASLAGLVILPAAVKGKDTGVALSVTSESFDVRELFID
jgi:hypothetical protein